LCFPLLAHELGHFIAFLDRYVEALRKETSEVSKVTIDEVAAALRRFPVTSSFDVIITKRTKLANQVSVCQRELLADLLATRMMGLSFFFAQAEYLKTMAPWSQPRILSTGNPEGYPGIRFRLWSILRHLIKFHPNNPYSFLDTASPENSDADALKDYLDEWSKTLQIQESDPPKGSDQNEDGKLETELARIVERKVLNSLEGIRKTAERIVPDDNCAKLTSFFFERILKLRKNLPPSCARENSQSFSEIMSAAWAYQVLYGEQNEADRPRNVEKYREYNKTCDLVLKAIELIPAAQNVKAPRRRQSRVPHAEDWMAKSGVLSKEHLIHRIGLPVSDPSHLAVLPTNLKAINGASMDVHLGNWFSYARRTKLNTVEINNPKQKELLSTIGREEAFVPIGRHFLLHPGDLVLGATQEFIGLPSDIMAFVEGKSGLGRLGLFVATATQVAPGFHGVIVLELANAGTVPLDLSPGMPIAQLVFQTMTHPTGEYDGESSCQIKP
jgi:dCTP deaminase